MFILHEVKHADVDGISFLITYVGRNVTTFCQIIYYTELLNSIYTI